MFSFIKKYAESISGIDIYPNIALFLFFLVFIAMIWFALKADKNYLHELEQLPIGDDGIPAPLIKTDGTKGPVIHEPKNV